MKGMFASWRKSPRRPLNVQDRFMECTLVCFVVASLVVEAGRRLLGPAGMEASAGGVALLACAGLLVVLVVLYLRRPVRPEKDT